MRAAFRRLLATSAVAAVIAGCSAGPASKATFVARADTICDRVAAATDPLAFQLFALDPTPAELANLMDRVLPRLEQGLADLRRLHAPRADRSAVARILRMGENEVARFKAYRAVAGEYGRTDDFFNRIPFAAFKAEAANYALTRCARDRHGPGEERGVPEAQRAAFSAAKKTFLAEGDAACQANSRGPAEALYYQNFAYYRDLSVEPPSLTQWAGMLGPDPRTPATKGTLIPFFGAYLDALRKLTPPPPDRALIGSILDRYATLGAKAEETGDMAAVGNRSGFRARLAEMAALSAPADKALRDYGFTRCAPADSLLVARVARDVFRLP